MERYYQLIGVCMSVCNININILRSTKLQITHCVYVGHMWSAGRKADKQAVKFPSRLAFSQYQLACSRTITHQSPTHPPPLTLGPTKRINSNINQYIGWMAIIKGTNQVQCQCRATGRFIGLLDGAIRKNPVQVWPKLPRCQQYCHWPVE